MKVIVVSGGFDPLHSGHISYLKGAKEMGDRLLVALNSDHWLKNKKGNFFMSFEERKNILAHLEMVDDVIGFEDDEEGTCKNALLEILHDYPNDEIIFCNGGDRNEGNIPEMEVQDISFAFSVGGDDKKNSSSWILKKWQYSNEERVWGSFYNLFEDQKVKVKELIVKPGKGMSFQRHFHRSEIWYVSHGSCEVNFSKSDPEDIQTIRLNTDDIFHVKTKEWHQIINKGKNDCHIIEIQYGEKTSEDDIERLYLHS